MFRRLVKRMFMRAGFELSRRRDLDLPMLHAPLVDGKRLRLWLTHPATKAWWHKDEIGLNAELRELKRLAMKGATVVEVGAHHGFMTLLLADWVGTDGRVFAIEASPENALVLDANCFENSRRNVKVTCAAAGEADGIARFGGESLAASSSVVREVPMVSVDGICQSQGIEQVDLLKIDVEGFELGVLSGARSVLESRAKIALELHLDLLDNANTTAAEVWAFLEEHASIGSRNVTMVARPKWEEIVNVESFSDIPRKGVANIFID